MKNDNFREQFDIDYQPEENGTFSEGMASIAVSQMMQGQGDADEIFVRLFVNEQMEPDFPEIANDFLLHIGSRLNDYADDIFGVDSMDVQSPLKAMHAKIMNMILAASRDDDEYAAELIRCMYKTYYRKEYKDLKRFRSISYDELCAFENDDEPLEETMARILTVLFAFGISLQGDIAIAYIRIHEYYEEDFLPDFPTEVDFLELDQKIVKRNQEEANKVYAPYYSSNQHLKKNMNKIRELDRFKNNVFQYFGMIENYDFKCNKEPVGLARDYAITKTIVEMTYPNKSFSDEEMRMFLFCYCLIKAFTTQITAFDEELDALFGRENDWRLDESQWKHVEEKQRKSNTTEKKTEPRITKIIPVDQAPDAIEMEEQVEALQTELRQKEQKLQHVQNMYRDSSRRLKEKELDEEKIRDEHEELINLRNFVYSLTEEDIHVSRMDPASMESVIRDRKIVIIGGHGNWTSQLRQKFPSWKFVKPSISVANNPHVVDDADYVYFFTDTICHSTYGIFIHLVREKNIPFGYIHSTNIEKNIEQIYEDTHES